jgi:uncharacterized transporter YbjL
VTRPAVNGKTLRELDFESACSAVVTRVTRADIEFTAREDVHLQLAICSSRLALQRG